MKEKIKTLDKNDEKLKLKKITKKQKLQERGITLVALVVTIIILLILAGVTLNIALSDNGLFSKTKEAAEKYKQAQSEEKDLISQFATQMYSEYVGAEVMGYTLTQKEVTIEGTTSGLTSNKDENGNVIADENINGTDGSQKFTTDTGMKWKVWDYDGNTLRIIGNQTNQRLTLQGVAGYNNGVWAINEICEKLYSNGKEGVSATSLKRTDIQKISTYDYTKFSSAPSDNENRIYFGESKTYTDNNKYPKMWEENDKDWTYKYNKGNITGGDKECKTWEIKGEGKLDDEMAIGDTSTDFKQSYYAHVYEQNEFVNDLYYDMIFKNATYMEYWLAGRCTSVVNNEDKCNFKIQYVWANPNADAVDGRDLCFSTGEETTRTCRIRPIVSINLKEGNCKMKTTMNEDGKITKCELSW